MNGDTKLPASASVMATYQEKLRKNLSCPACDEAFDRDERLPKGLPCSHSLCLCCLDKYVKPKPEYVYLCPICQAKFRIPEEGTKSLANTPRIIEMIELLDNPDNAETGMNLCDQDIKLEDKKIDIPKCHDHSSAVCILYCKDCNVPLCIQCMTLSKTHNSHTLEDIASMAEMVNTDVENIINVFNQIVNDVADIFDETRDDLFREKNEILSKISKDIAKKAEKFYDTCKQEVINHLQVGFQEFCKFSDDFDASKKVFQTNFNKYRASEFYNYKNIEEMQNRLQLLEFYLSYLQEIKKSKSKFTHDFLIEGYFKLNIKNKK